MSDGPDPIHKAIIERLMRQLQGFALGVGLVEETTRHIVNRIIADLPSAPDDARLARPRNWVLVASA